MDIDMKPSFLRSLPLIGSKVQKQDQKRPMFSEEDTRLLFDQFSASLPSDRSGQPVLLSLRSRSGLLRTQDAHRRILALLESGPDRWSISSIAKEVDLGDDIVRDILKDDTEPHYSILDGQDTVITRHGYDNLLKQLYEQARQGPVLLGQFCNNCNISENVFKTLFEDSNARRDVSEAISEGDLLIIDRVSGIEYIYSKQYQEKLESEILNSLEDLQEPQLLKPSSFTGSPPAKLLEEIVERLVHAKIRGLNGNLRPWNGDVEFLPAVFLQKEREDLMNKLRTGEVASLDFSEHGNLFSSSEEQREYVLRHSNNQAIIFMKKVISRVHFDEVMKVVRGKLDEGGYASLDEFKLLLSAAEYQQLQRLALENLYETDDEDRESIEIVEDSFVQSNFKASIAKSIKLKARLQARDVWENQLEARFSWASIIEAERKEHVGLSQSTASHLLGDDMRPEAEKAFKEEMRQLQFKSNDQLASLWREKVLTRFELYQIGVRSIENEKIRRELITLLQDYMADEVIPDTLRRAESKSIIRGKATKRNVDILRAFLASFKGDARKRIEISSPLVEAMDAFANQQKISLLDAGTLSERKLVQVQEMVKGMRKDEEGPRLFLILILVLFAKLLPGLIYATGKYAPRLLKQLRGLIDSEQYTWLEKMKDAAKAGSMTAADKSDIRDAAGEACSILEGGPSLSVERQ
ncbi:MAG: hypothetical protein M1819_007478 [Sarea resinae]|nr:MAG: hypothetical protein M1819_007478 [Sarea resinae]